MKLLISILLFPILAFGQTKICGKIINSKTKKGISFATIGLTNENIGTTANEDGYFTLNSLKPYKFDTLIFSCVGFKTLKIPAHINQTENIVIELNEQINLLNEVVVAGKYKWNILKLNDFSNCGNRFITSNGFQTQLAQHFQVNEENSILTNIRICRSSVAIFDPEKTIFRVRIYDIDTLRKSPSTDLCTQIIEVKTKSKFIDLNLEKYKIAIPKRDFFVAIEWLKIPFNESKSKMNINGTEVEHITFRPSIGWTDNINSKMEAWSLDYNNVWRPMFSVNGKTNVSISATVKY